MTLQEFKNQIKREIEENPNLKEEILDLYQLAIDEIDEGGSATHEIELCLEDITQLKNDNLFRKRME